jgi:hypothetical protein
MVTADLVLQLAVVLLIFVVLLTPRIMIGRMETLAHHKRRHARVRSMRGHTGLRHIKHAA